MYTQVNAELETDLGYTPYHGREHKVWIRCTVGIMRRCVRRETLGVQGLGECVRRGVLATIIRLLG